MPLVNVKIWAQRLEEEGFVERVQKAMTDVIVGELGEESREHTWVIIEGVPQEQWSIGAK